MPDKKQRWLFASPDALLDVSGSITRAYLADEAETIASLLDTARLTPDDTRAVLSRARELVGHVRARNREFSPLDAFMSEYDLSSSEGIVLMCLAEALLRIPDAETADRLIADKLSDADFKSHLGSSDSLFVNAATWGLMLTGRILKSERADPRGLATTFDGALARLGEPAIRAGLRHAMRILGHQFVMGRTIHEALERAKRGDGRIYRYSFDMLGESALTAVDARSYLDAYAQAIEAISERSRVDETPPQDDVLSAPSISVKLSALCPRLEVGQAGRAIAELAEQLGALARQARDAGVGLTIDAEEAHRLDLTLAVFHEVHKSAELGDWPGLGIAVQSYQKRARPVIEWLAEFARAARTTIPVRLCKGAYWDTEIKLAQEKGLAGYPVFTRKSSTDVSYLACARLLLDAGPALYPQFATHNAHTVAWIEHVGARREFEFQRLHGMGQALYATIATEPDARPCRVYAPVGSSAVCLRMAQTPHSSTASSTRTHQSTTSCGIRSPRPRCWPGALHTRAFLCRVISLDRSGATRPDSTLQIRANSSSSLASSRQSMYQMLVR
jgi:RHH-type proline utilization regulon transcriptional repressor/proline dehydrogenase/delta 1-pyrroline-5-carboxylate dehydrogenase